MKKLILAASSLLLALLLADVVLRVRRAWRDRVKNTWPDPVLHHKWAPSRTTIDRARSIPYALTINAQSWVEEYDVVRENPVGVFRMFYVGDSTTQGVVAPEYKMVELVERELNRRCEGSGVRFEVINTGTSSYSFLNYYLLIRTILLDYAPDLVVINVDMTDMINDYVYRQSAVTDAAGAVAAIRPPAEDFRFQYLMGPEGVVRREEMPALYRFLVKHSGIFYYLERVRGRDDWRRIEAGLDVDESANWLSMVWSQEVRQNIDASMAVLAKTVAALRSRGVRVALTGVPHYGQYTGALSSEPHAVLGWFARSNRVPYLNVYEALDDKIGGSGQAEYYWAEDPSHFNREGNRIWAEAQLAFLLDPGNGLLPSYPGHGQDD